MFEDDEEVELICEDCGAPYGSSFDNCPHCEIDAQSAKACPSFTQKRMCGQCPFRKDSAGGWLGDYSPREVISVIQTEQHFFCHSKLTIPIPIGRRNLTASRTVLARCR